jgi:hypothetical protein
LYVAVTFDDLQVSARGSREDAKSGGAGRALFEETDVGEWRRHPEGKLRRAGELAVGAPEQVDGSPAKASIYTRLGARPAATTNRAR